MKTGDETFADTFADHNVEALMSCLTHASAEDPFDPNFRRLFRRYLVKAYRTGHPLAEALHVVYACGLMTYTFTHDISAGLGVMYAPRWNWSERNGDVMGRWSAFAVPNGFTYDSACHMLRVLTRHLRDMPDGELTRLLTGDPADAG